MKDYEKQIEEAAYKYSHSRLNNGYYTFLEGAKSEAAKEFHQQGMYSEEEVKAILLELSCELDSIYPFNSLIEWFNQNKKNLEPTKTAECPIGSYEAENKVADCVGSDDCRELCKTCINYTKP